MIEQVSFGTETIALILRNSFNKEGIEFFTPDNYSQQLAYMNRPTGYVIPPHVHNPIKREVQFTQEVLFIKSGIVRVDFYSEETLYIESKLLKAGDVILLSSGGHGFQIIESAEIIEVKQGPYAGEKDKTRFVAVELDQLKINENTL